MVTAIWGIAAVVFFLIAFVAAVYNLKTPLQLGPVPVIGGVVLGMICLVAFIARVVR